MKTKSKVALYALGIAGTFAALTYNAVLNYNIPPLSYECLESAKEKIIYAENEYEVVYNWAVQQSYDTLKTNPKYVTLSQELENLETKIENGTDDADIIKYMMLESTADSIAQDLRTKHINNNKIFIDARTVMEQAHENYNNIVRARATADSIRKQPITTRLHNNWQQMTK